MQIGIRRILLGLTVTATALTSTASLSAQAAAPARRTYASALSPADIARLSANQTEKVIVLMRDQHPALASRATTSSRARALASDQSHVADELRSLHAPSIRGYSLLNAVSATVSHAEAQRLATDPSVLAVVPDALVKASAHTTAQASTAAIPATVAAPAPGVCPADPAKPLLEPEALQSMHVENGPGSTSPAAHDLATGTGVKVAVFPDGLDPSIPNWQRGGHSVIFDYQDFSGDGTAARTNGAEAFGDVSSLAAQGVETYDLSQQVNPAYPLPPGCNIRIKGVAPGADVAVMKVFGDASSAFNSLILQGIEYAVLTDHVDILSQSFGGNPIPNPGLDPIALADAQAVALGVTVVVSSGDAGTTNTIGTPATNPGVISAAGTTNYRLYAQTGSYGYKFGGNGWVSDETSALSSSGLTEYGPRTVDVMAGGEAGWANCSSNTALYTGCKSIYHGSAPQPIIAFGGTSQSCPFVAGTAALVIEAYRSTHGGITPTPATVKQIIKSSAQDLNIKPDNQGAGMVDALRAVQVARSFRDANGTPSRIGTGLVYSINQVTLAGAPGTTSTVPVTVTNSGVRSQDVAPRLQTLGVPTPITSGTVSLTSASPTFKYQTGADVHYVTPFTFNVDPGQDRLVTRVAWDTAGANTGSTVRVTLFDPQGRMAAHSRPQGAGGGFGEDEIHNPTFGTWTMLVFTTGAPQYQGPVNYDISEAQFQTAGGAVTPSTLSLAPGSSGTFNIQVKTPVTPGDRADAVAFSTSYFGSDQAPAAASIPVLLRSIVPAPGQFTGTLTGGNARMPFYGQELVYQFDVPKGAPEINVDVNIPADGYQVLGFLVAPDQSPRDVQSTQDMGGPDQSGNVANYRTMHLSWFQPISGRWTLDFAQVNGISSLRTSTPLAGRINFNAAPISATSLPQSTATRLTRGQTATAHVHVVNNGNSPAQYSIDARRNDTVQLSLASLTPTSGTLPIAGSFPQFVVPPFTTRLDVAASSTVPIDFSTSPNFGYPEILSRGQGADAVATYSAPMIPASAWGCPPTEIGPFATSAPIVPYSCGAMAVTRAFDTTVTTSTGNPWSALEGITANYTPLVLLPGQSGDITVSIKPNGSVGSVASGILAVQTFNNNTISSDEVKFLPYTYTVR